MNVLPGLSDKKIILASKSPRRQQLLAALDVIFEIKTKETDESFPLTLSGKDIALYLARTKADAFRNEMNEQEIYITADTLVCVGNKVLNKPSTQQEAVQMLTALSHQKHTVHTAVAITSLQKQVMVVDSTDVYFLALSPDEIDYYIKHFRPYDKAGAYGVQEWIGYIGIEKIVGSYYTVMGLPTHLLYDALKKFQ